MLKLWRKTTLSDRLYKIEEKKNHKFENDIDSIYSAEDTENALIRSMNSPIEFLDFRFTCIVSFVYRFICLQVRNSLKISNMEILGRCILPTIKRWRLKGREMSAYKF